MGGKVVREHTVACDISLLILGYCEQRGPCHHVLHVVVDIVVLGEGIEVCETHVEEVLRAEGTEGCHIVVGYLEVLY